MRRDGRGFDHRTLEAIRLMAVERVRGGELPSSAIASFGFNRTTIYRWLEVASKPGMGLSALRRKGQTPVVERPGQRQSISAASAVNARGAFWYCTYEGGGWLRSCSSP